MNLDKFLGCTFGVAIGDALGMPFETMSACEIQNRVGEIEKFESPSLNPHIFSSLEHLPEGSWTDDTRLTLATMEAFVEARGRFSMKKIKEAHVKAFGEDRRGWGRSTRKACGRLAGGAHWRNSGEPNGSGNGVIMKISPLGLWNSIMQEELRPFVDKCLEFAKMTHLGTPAIVGGIIHAFAINTLASRDFSGVRHIFTFLDFFKELALGLEDELPPCDDKISDQIVEIMRRGTNGDLGTASAQEIASWFGGGTSYACNSFGLSYALFARSVYTNDLVHLAPFSAVFEAVEAGGDTDSNASIVGSLVGALHGVKIIPADLIAGVEKSEMIRELTEKFFEACNPKAK